MAKYYYDRLRTQILPRDADVNLIIGARGLGKTYGVRRYMLEDYIKNNICFVEVTRYREENNDVAAKYFDRIIEDNIFPDYDFRVHNKVAEIRRNGDKNWRTCGYFIPLSLQQQKKKSTYVNVRNICMDEIIIDPDDVYHHYLRNEYEQLANLVDTVTRERADDSKLRKPRIFLLGNACDACNPYFEHYDVPLEPEFGLQWLDGKTCIFDYVEDDKYAAQKTKNTVAGRMMKNNDDVTAKTNSSTITLIFSKNRTNTLNLRMSSVGCGANMAFMLIYVVATFLYPQNMMRARMCHILRSRRMIINLITLRQMWQRT